MVRKQPTQTSLTNLQIPMHFVTTLCKTNILLKFLAQVLHIYDEHGTTFA
jgi:hypothetical protein